MVDDLRNNCWDTKNWVLPSQLSHLWVAGKDGGGSLFFAVY